MEQIESHNMERATKAQISRFVRRFKLQKYLVSCSADFREVNNADNPQINLHTCPFCKNVNYKGNEHPWRAYLSINNKMFKCFNCDTEGSLFKFIAKNEGKTIAQVMGKYFGGDYWETLPQELMSDLVDPYKSMLNDEDTLQPIELPTEFEAIYERPTAKYKAAHMYMDMRGFRGIRDLKLPRYKHNPSIERIFTEQQLGQEFDIRFCRYWEMPREGKKPIKIMNRVIFPVWWKFPDDSWHVVGWQGRDITGESPLKYYISENFRKQEIIYNYWSVFEAEEIVITEGIFDAIKCYSHNPICLFGKSISNTQLQLLQQMPNLKSVIIALDEDTHEATKSGKVPFDVLVEKLRPFFDVKEIKLPAGKDCGDMSFVEMKDALNKATPIKKKGLVSNLI